MTPWFPSPDPGRWVLKQHLPNGTQHWSVWETAEFAGEHSDGSHGLLLTHGGPPDAPVVLGAAHTRLGTTFTPADAAALHTLIHATDATARFGTPHPDGTITLDNVRI